MKNKFTKLLALPLVAGLALGVSTIPAHAATTTGTGSQTLYFNPVVAPSDTTVNLKDYDIKFYKLNFDGTPPTLLSDYNADHSIPLGQSPVTFSGLDAGYYYYELDSDGDTKFQSADYRSWLGLDGKSLYLSSTGVSQYQSPTINISVSSTNSPVQSSTVTIKQQLIHNTNVPVTFDFFDLLTNQKIGSVTTSADTQTTIPSFNRLYYAMVNAPSGYYNDPWASDFGWDGKSVPLYNAASIQYALEPIQ